MGSDWFMGLRFWYFDSHFRFYFLSSLNHNCNYGSGKHFGFNTLVFSMAPLMIMAASQKGPCGSLSLHVPFVLIDCQVNSCNLWYFSCEHRAFLGRHSHHAQENI